jgi:hypothetical protein
MDEDSFDSEALKKAKESVPRSSTAPDSIPSTSSYASPTESSFAHSSGKPTTSTHPQALATETASPSPGPSIPDSRRRSNTSSDSMDPIYYGQGHGYASSPMGNSAAPRGYATTAPPGETSVKLTPITGRVSRAKKGVPVHTCEQCTKVGDRAPCTKLETDPMLVDFYKSRALEVRLLQTWTKNQG